MEDMEVRRNVETLGGGCVGVDMEIEGATSLELLD